MPGISIQTTHRIIPMVYAYSTPEIARHDGHLKIGYTDRQTVEDRVHQQGHTVDVIQKIEWKGSAIFDDGSGETFTDNDFRAYLYKLGYEKIDRTEYVKIPVPESRQRFYEYKANRGIVEDGEYDTTPYALRAEQQDAVAMTRDYAATHPRGEFLWNAKPRFGKTLSVYDLVLRMKAQKVLIVTNRPAIANSWYADYEKFIGREHGYFFVSSVEGIQDKPLVMSYDDYERDARSRRENRDARPMGLIEFVSLQDLKGSIHFGGEFRKLEHVATTTWDVLVIDEAHEGIDTYRTDAAFDRIRRNFTLHLSGTPFKALANDKFPGDAIYNWTYADEQEAKETWAGDEHNPYRDLPRLNLFTYRMSDIVREQARQGMELDEEGAVDYAFDLGEFFKTREDGKFEHEADVRKFLHALTTQEKFPFATDELRREMAHTLWLLNRVDSAKALAKLLKEEGSGFEDYEVVLAAGDGRLDDNAETIKSYNKVKNAIAGHDRTITLSVGQLTTGVTIPEWSGVLMLSNMQSAQLYMQAAFRAQNPYEYSDGGRVVRKDNAYVFDFDPARTLMLYDEFANNLKKSTAGGNGTTEERQQNIKQLLNFFPVIAEDEKGRMTQIDERQVLSIPRRIKCEEVVRRGFMSNLLFRNIAGIFSAPAVVGEILGKIDKAHEERGRTAKTTLDEAANVDVDESGEVAIPTEVIIGQEQHIFGDKVYKTFDKIETEIDNADNVLTAIDKVSESLQATIEQHIIQPAADEYGLRQAQSKRMAKDSKKELETTMEKIKGDYEQRRKIAEVKHQDAIRQATSEKDVADAETTLRKEMEEAMQEVNNAIKEVTNEIASNKPKEVIERIERDKEERRKASVEEEVRAHLRGFARTIPSFVMAYDDGGLALANFDKNIEDSVFKEVTSITLDEFRFLRDGGEYEENGVTKHFDGHLFDEVVFDDAIAEFRKKRQELANYFDESLDEDIFDYIPPQKTNQIFTPKWVVRRMVDMLEQENPHIFEDPEKTFADLYMKSGLYITEIVRRLYNNAEMRRRLPDDRERIRHILVHQVYGFAPTRIIYLIATRYILGFEPSLKPEKSNFRQVDTVPYAKEGRMAELLDSEFGK
mgnify:CR=1 FL=1